MPALLALQEPGMDAKFSGYSTFQGGHSTCNLKTRGRKLAELISTLRLTLLRDPAYPTRVGNSVTRYTCPALSLVKNAGDAAWENLGYSLGSDHMPSAGYTPGKSSA
ncbi:hypothetical protein HPB49_021837 [Dermacentor silvarum]|uniref:Uncharacterized protein n=1 Tax=Dermacentor silvarum TaxID=543639 RepID=A0ACB8CBF0_DERSI|nr:hypothetical protein HPB49_021837 [Dermacentor silvarum]